jgi:outer membrane lipoprotein-sorting protein
VKKHHAKQVIRAVIACSVVLLPLTNSLAATTNNQTIAEQLCKNYARIKTLSCEIRKTTKSEGLTIRLLSRVHYQYPDHIHVDNAAPVKRTIIADGQKLYYYQDGMPLGFSRPVSELSPTWLRSLRNIPATPIEHLLPLKGIKEDKLPAASKDQIRRGYPVKTLYIVLTVDNKMRVDRVEFFKSSQMKTKTAEYTYSKQQEVLPGCWIPTIHKATLYLPNEKTAHETRIIANLAVNKTIPSKIFDHQLFMQKVKFSDNFADTYKKAE